MSLAIYECPMGVPEGGEYRCTYRTGGSSAVAAFSDGRPLRGRSLRCWAVRRFVVATRRLAYGY